MAENKKVFYSFKEFGEEFRRLNQENLEKQGVLQSYGVDIPLEEMQNIEILEKNGASITYWNRKENESVTSHLLSNIYEKWSEGYSVCLTTCNPDKTFFVEHFHSIDAPKTYIQAGKNALKSRKNPGTKLLSRAYADISTKYGDFCLHIEEGYTDYKFGPYRFVSLYYGNHEQVMIDWMNDFDFSKYGILRWRYGDQYKFSQWFMGFEDEKFDCPKRNTWKYGESNDASPIYASTSRTSTNSGAIFMRGISKIDENIMYIPEIFDYYCRLQPELKEYEDLDCTSKAYFCNYSECVAILKQGSNISMEYKKKDFKTHNWIKGFSVSIASATTQEFTQEDFKNIITKLEAPSISDSLKTFTISELESYKNIHNADDFESLDKFTLEPYHFEDMLQYLEKKNLIEVVEKGIESLSSTFHMDIEEILGQNPPNQTKEPPYVKKNIKRQ